MSTWTSETITRFSQEGENDFADEYPCLLKRIALTIIGNTNTYTLPEDVRSIRRITWQGFKLDPLGQRNFREVFQSATQVGRPFWYVFNNIGANNIQFFPTPGTAIAQSGSNLYSDGIATDVIVEYFALPDYVSLIIPAYFRRRLIKGYVLKMCFAIEGPGQNVKSSQYFDKKYEDLKHRYGSFLNEIHNKSRKLCLNGLSNSQFFPGTPVLPIARFGIGVQNGE